MARFLKFLVALLLLPLIAAEIWTLADLAVRLTPAGRWHETWLTGLAAGFAVWLLIFFCLPRAMWFYVLGHEFTHALAVILSGGKVSAFRVSSKGGHVMSDRVNWWIGLSPYFVPIYALIWMGLWVTVDFYYSLRAWQALFYFGLGLLWAFHVTFTISMLHGRQTDLSREGFVFSGVIIALFNLGAIGVLLAFLSHNFSLAAAMFWHRVCWSYTFTGRELAHGARWLFQQARQLRA
jgi:hypothetical protein